MQWSGRRVHQHERGYASVPDVWGQTADDILSDEVVMVANNSLPGVREIYIAYGGGKGDDA